MPRYGILLWYLGLLLVSWPAFAGADDDPVVVTRVAAQVSLLRDQGVWLDRGADAGIRVGARVRIFPIAGGELSGRVTAVDPQSARVAVQFAEGTVAEGDRAEVEVSPPPAASDAYDHSPWERPVPKAEGDEPLLAPAFQRTARDRPLRVTGRITTYLSANYNLEDTDQKSYQGRIGTDVRVRNPFGEGGELRVDGDLTGRVFEAGDSSRREDNEFRLDRLYYRWGGNRGDRVEAHVGRFYPVLASEVGLHDGVGGVLSLTPRSRVSATLGALPDPSRDRSSTGDVGVTLSYEFQSTGKDSTRVAATLHQSWHHSERDRSLLLLSASGRPTPEVFLFAQAWIDHYDSSDSIKSSGLELTELIAHGSWAVHPDHRVRVAFTRLLWPELLRSEFEPIAAAALDANELTRTSLSTDHRLARWLRLQLRGTVWEDQDRDGTTGELRVRLPHLLHDSNELEVALFFTEGATTEGPGGRLSFRQRHVHGSVQLSYEYRRTEFTSITVSRNPDQRHRLFAVADWHSGGPWYASATGDYFFGDDEESIALSLLLQYRF